MGSFLQPSPRRRAPDPGVRDVCGLDGDTRPLDVEGFIDARPFSGFQWLVMALCFLVIAADGFDTVAIGYVGPALVHQWGLPQAALGPLFSSALVGAAFGALMAGPLGDRVGRKWVLFGSIVTFGSFTFAGAGAQNLHQLAATRLIAGLGLGAAMPNAVTLLSEFSPERHRALIVNAMFCGFTLGSSGGGFASAWLVSDYGWRIIFVLGGVVPLVLSAAMIWMPESIRFLVTRGRGEDRVRRTLQRIDARALISATSFIVTAHDVVDQRSPVAVILSRRFRVGSSLLWLTYFMGLVVYLGLTSWLPTLMSGSGHTLREASLTTAILSLGAGVGPLLLGWLMDRVEPHGVVAGSFFLASFLVWWVGHSIDAGTLLPWLMFTLGVFLSGALTSMPVIAATYYPTQARASGVAWMLGIGRFGGILGAAGGGSLLKAGFGTSSVLSILAMPAFAAGAALLAKHVSDRRSVAQVGGIATIEASSP